MKIGMICHSGFGGSVRIATGLATELARRGHRVHLFARSTPFRAVDGVSGVELHPTFPDSKNEDLSVLYAEWPGKEIDIFVARILDVIAEHGLDILHFHYAVPFAFVASEIKRQLGPAAPALVGTLHGSDVSLFGRDPVKGPSLARALGSVDVLTTVSGNHSDLSAGVFGLSDRPEVIPNFVDRSIFYPRKSRSDNRIRNEDRPLIVYLSNFRPVKNPRGMAKIFVAIRSKIKAHLWLIGAGPELEHIMPIFRKEKVEKEVLNWGFRREVAPLLACADLLLISSISESFSLAALEAMACGVPVLAPKVGGIPEVVTHGKAGLLFPAGDHRRAAHMGTEILSNSAFRQKMGAEGVKHAMKFDQEKIVSEYETLYKRYLYPSSTGSFDRLTENETRSVNNGVVWS